MIATVSAVNTLLQRARSAVRSRLDLDDGNDRGFTLTEVMASMAIMTFFMVMFTGSIIQMYSSSNKADATTQSASQLNTAFTTLDKEIRYASAINKEGLGSDPANPNDYYIEFLNTSTSATDSNCTQLRLSGGNLQQRTWVNIPATAPAWTTLATNVAAPSGAKPFTMLAAGGSQINQRMALNLVSTQGTGRDATKSSTSYTFTAMNSGQYNSASNDGVTLVCQSGVGRP